MAKQTIVRHFKHSADIRRLVLVEEIVCRWRIGIFSVVTFEKSQSYQRIKKIAGRPWMQAKPPGDGIEILRTSRQFGEDFHFDSA